MLDGRILDKVSDYDPEGLHRALQQRECEACGAGPMVTVMMAARELGAKNSKVLKYANSGDVTGDRSGVVGYMAAAVYGDSGSGGEKKESNPGAEVEDRKKAGTDLGLSADEKRALWKLAIDAVRAKVSQQTVKEPEDLPPKLKEPRGAFVTLRKNGELRGCIGLIEAEGPLYRTVQDMAVQAAFADPRFPPLSPAELDEIEVEISALTPLERIRGPSEIEVGKHGLVIKKGYRTGLLLPQVATEHGWSVEEFLEWTCRKAGLPTTAWKDPDTEIYAFSADVF
jgi:hypothetical protein